MASVLHLPLFWGTVNSAQTGPIQYATLISTAIIRHPGYTPESRSNLSPSPGTSGQWLHLALTWLQGGLLGYDVHGSCAYRLRIKAARLCDDLDTSPLREVLGPGSIDHCSYLWRQIQPLLYLSQVYATAMTPFPLTLQ